MQPTGFKSKFHDLLSVPIDEEEDSEMVSKRNMFLESNVTSYDYIRQRDSFTSLEEHMNMIPLFIARLKDHFVVREVDC